MRWLIIEDALRDRRGHWFEYLGTFACELRALGDEVTILADRAAEPFVVDQLKVKPTLPASIWHRMGDSAGAVRRCLRVPVHAWQTYRAARKYFQQNKNFDVVFVPTVLVHHLLGWFFLIKTFRPAAPVLLFFPNLPIRLTADGVPAWNASPTTRLTQWLLAKLQPELEMGRVFFGVETHAMREALAKLTGLRVNYFPHPVCTLNSVSKSDLSSDAGEISLGCYGPARHEKGSDILMQAIGLYLQRFPENKMRFVFQWMEGFHADSGGFVRLDERLMKDKRVEVVRRFFGEGEYVRYLARTDIMLLPYRRSSYDLRVSRVVIEAMTCGLPVVVTRGTTLAEQISEFGSGVNCADGDVESLVHAIEQMRLNYPALREKARQHQAAAREHFSVLTFRKCLVNAIAGNSVAGR